MIERSRKGWDKCEPGTPLPPEHPRFFEHLVYRALAEDYIGESKAAELLGMSVHDFHARRQLDDAPNDPASPGNLHARPHQ